MYKVNVTYNAIDFTNKESIRKAQAKDFNTFQDVVDYLDEYGDMNIVEVLITKQV